MSVVLHARFIDWYVTNSSYYDLIADETGHYINVFKSYLRCVRVIDMKCAKSMFLEQYQS